MKEVTQVIPPEARRWVAGVVSGAIALAGCGPVVGTEQARPSPSPSAVVSVEPSPSSPLSSNAYEGQRYRVINNGPGQLNVQGRGILSGEQDVENAVADISESCGEITGIVAQKSRQLSVTTVEQDCVRRGIHEQTDRVVTRKNGKTFTVDILTGEFVFIQAKASTGLLRGGRDDGENWVNSICYIKSKSVVPVGADLNPGEYAKLQDPGCSAKLIAAFPPAA